MPSRRLPVVLAAAVLLATSACGSDNPPGTIGKDDLPGNVEVRKVRHDDQAGQVLCQAVNDAEDNYVMTPSVNYDRDKRAAVAYEFKGPHFQGVSNSVWRVSHPQEIVEDVAAALAKCATDQPENYQRFAVADHPHALGYVETGNDGVVTTRRILVPLEDRVVIVSSTRDGGSDFTVQPEDLLKKAIAVSEDAPTS